MKRITASTARSRTLALMMLFALPATTFAAIRFDAAFTPYESGKTPRSVRAADFNEDGRMDVAACDYGSGTVSIHLGQGDGTLAKRITVDAWGWGLSVGDLNADGHTDLVVVSFHQDFVHLLFGRGDGTFTSGPKLPTGHNPIQAAVGDLNGDGRNDLAVANYRGYPATGPGTVSVLIANPDGTYQPQREYPTGRAPYSVAIGHLDGDAVNDIAIANATSCTVDTFLGNGDGTFRNGGSFPTGRTPVSVVIADLDRDGTADLATANADEYGLGRGVSVMLGRGPGRDEPIRFSAETAYRAGGYPAWIESADLNADGRLDLVVPSATSNGLSILLGNGDGTFRDMPETRAGSWPMSVAITDLDADGRLDMIAANERSDFLAVTLGNGDGTFGKCREFATGRDPEAVAVADLDGDGRADAVTANTGANTASILRGLGDGTFGPRTDIVVADEPRALAIAHLDGDGRPDVTVANREANTLSILLGQADGSYLPAVEPHTGSRPNALTVADVNSDGILDVAVANRSSNTVSVLLGLGGGAFARRVDLPVGLEPWSVAAADVDGDGDVDLVVPNSESQTISVLLGAGDGSFAAHREYATGALPTCVAVADLNRDGHADLAITSSGSNTVTVLLGIGDGTFGTRTDLAAGQVPYFIAAGDLDLDGRVDLAVANHESNVIRVLAGRGDGTFEEAIGFGVTGNVLSSLAVRDLDGDRLPELVVTGSRSDGVSVLRNRSPLPQPSLVMGLEFTPRTLDRASKGRWVTGVLVPAGPHSARDIDVGSIRVNGSVPVDPSAPVVIRGGNKTGALMVGFDRAQVVRTLASGDRVPVVVTGQLAGNAFVGSDTVRVKHGTGVAVDDEQLAMAGLGQLSLRILSPSPVPDGRVRLAMTLRDASPARVELLDVAGRVVVARAVGAGSPVLELTADGLLPGVYFARLTQGATVANVRTVVLR